MENSVANDRTSAPVEFDRAFLRKIFACQYGREDYRGQTEQHENVYGRNHK